MKIGKCHRARPISVHARTPISAPSCEHVADAEFALEAQDGGQVARIDPQAVRLGRYPWTVRGGRDGTTPMDESTMP